MLAVAGNIMLQANYRQLRIRIRALDVISVPRSGLARSIRASLETGKLTKIEKEEEEKNKPLGTREIVGALG